MTCGYLVTEPDAEHGEGTFQITATQQPDEEIKSCGMHLAAMLPLGVDVVVRREA